MGFQHAACKRTYMQIYSVDMKDLPDAMKSMWNRIWGEYSRTVCRRKFIVALASRNRRSLDSKLTGL